MHFVLVAPRVALREGLRQRGTSSTGDFPGKIGDSLICPISQLPCKMRGDA
jgi:hypothetical protein